MIVSKEMIIYMNKIPESHTMLKDKAKGLLPVTKDCWEHSVTPEVCARLSSCTAMVTGSAAGIFLEPFVAVDFRDLVDEVTHLLHVFTMAVGHGRWVCTELQYGK